MAEFFDVQMFASVRFKTMLGRSATDGILNLTYLSVTDAHVAKIIEQLKATPVAKIWLSFNSLTDTGVNILVAAMLQLRTFDLLQELCLASNRIGDASVNFLVHALSRGSRLRVLDVGSNRGVTDESVMILASYLRNSVLEKLVLSGTSVTDVGARQLVEAVKVTRLRDLRLSKTRITSQTVNALAQIVRTSCLINVIANGAYAGDVSAQENLKSEILWKNSPEVRLLTTLCAVHTLPRINATSLFRMFPPKHLPRLAEMICDVRPLTEESPSAVYKIT